MGSRFAITATGVVSFALTYINSARVHRVKGILLGKVIHKCYPMYGFFFLLHGAFVILGIYSCAVKVRAAGALSALGVLLCLIYAVNLAFHPIPNMWRSLLDELPEWQMQAKLAYLMLCRAGSGQGGQRRSSMAALSCGLLFYLHTPALSNSDHAWDVPKAGTDNVNQDGPVHCAYVLQQINRLRVQPTDRENTRRQYFIRTTCRDMGIVGLCLSALEQTFATKPVDHEAMLSVVYEVERGQQMCQRQPENVDFRRNEM